MAILGFTLSEEGVVAFHDVLACLSKFTEQASLEARKERLALTGLNLSKSAYASFTFAVDRFFSRYSYEGSPQHRERFFCQLDIRALLPVFRTRLGGDPSRDRETAIDRCEVTIDDAPGRKSRLTARIVSRNGITATHALPFEIKPPTHAKFDKDEAIHHWTISSRTLRQLMDHFGPGIELLDINTDGENVVNFSCFTMKAVKLNNEEVLKKPLHTSIAVEKEEFDDIEVEDKLHVIISVKDFRAILQHAQTRSGELSARYSNPGRPMKLSYGSDGIICDFILMTVGDRTNLGPQSKKGRGNVAARPALEAASSRATSVAVGGTANGGTSPQKEAPRAQPTPVQAQEPKPVAKPRPSLFQMRPPPMPPAPTPQDDSLFVIQVDEDQEWEPMNPEDEDDEMGDTARLEWNASAQPAQNPSTLRLSDYNTTQAEPPRQQVDRQVDRPPSGLEPTQRLAEVRRFGLFSP